MSCKECKSFDEWNILDFDLDQHQYPRDKCNKRKCDEKHDKDDNEFKEFLIKLYCILKQIKEEVDGCNDKINNPIYGLKAIKSEIVKLEKKLDEENKN